MVVRDEEPYGTIFTLVHSSSPLWNKHIAHDVPRRARGTRMLLRDGYPLDVEYSSTLQAS